MHEAVIQLHEVVVGLYRIEVGLRLVDGGLDRIQAGHVVLDTPNAPYFADLPKWGAAMCTARESAIPGLVVSSASDSVDESSFDVLP